jgi:hypothetical protein
MLDKLLLEIKNKFRLSPLDASDFAALKVSGMKFAVGAYEAAGLGHVSTMAAKGFFGLMRMDTLIIVPKDIDLPLLSYDRIKAFGNETLIIELYDTCLKKSNLESLKRLKDINSSFAKYETGSHWYDSIKLPESIGFKGKKKDADVFDALCLDYVKAYLALEADQVTDKKAKDAKSAVYVDGLLSNGGPSTDVFVKGIGKEKTTRLFKEILFGA